MSTLLSLLSLLSPVVTWILDKFAVSQAKREQFIKFVQSAKDDGIIAVEAKDEFAQQDAKLKLETPDKPLPPDKSDVQSRQ